MVACSLGKLLRRYILADISLFIQYKMFINSSFKFLNIQRYISCIVSYIILYIWPYPIDQGFSNFWCYGGHEEIDHNLRSTTINFINAVIASLDSCKIRQVSILIRTRIARGALGFRTEQPMQ